MKTFWKKLLPWLGLILATQSLLLWVYGMECVVTHYPNRGIGMLIAIGIALALSIIWVVVEMIIQAKKTKREKRNDSVNTYDKLFMETEIQYSYKDFLNAKNARQNCSKQWLAFRCNAIIELCESYLDLFGYNPSVKLIHEDIQKILKELDIK